jgi:hypothetical protein
MNTQFWTLIFAASILISGGCTRPIDKIEPTTPHTTSSVDSTNPFGEKKRVEVQTNGGNVDIDIKRNSADPDSKVKVDVNSPDVKISGDLNNDKVQERIAERSLERAQRNEERAVDAIERATK